MRLNRIASLFATGAIVISGVGCSNTYKDIEIQTEADPKVNFSGYSTYAWGGSAAVIVDPRGDWTPVDLNVGSEIMFLVDREMRKRGLAEVHSNPDVIVVYAVGVDMTALDVVIDDKTQGEQFEEIPKGGVLVVLSDPVSRRPMWAGSAVADLMDKPDDAVVRARLDYAITQMFKKLPK
jgi:hypothetical protein